MKASEGRLGRIFIVTLEADDKVPEAIEQFALERGVTIAQVVLTSDASFSGIIAPGSDGRPTLILSGFPEREDGFPGELVIQEILGVNVRRTNAEVDGVARLAMVPGSVTRVMEKPAPAPEESGPGTVPVYLFNAEFN